ncbi:SHOCT domain-containing protein [Agromyces cerinus]|uniref:Short C-terminal domain-containing protein n=1 Tax=Agromyces cerinus subsp. cerinus TaxID=232089 RepID=A0A1N6HAJ6_9MICO|nr:SHOCT domain-containing protein [Agromyces cerinus]SIO16689.1 hypothetical protein SAMN05443544_3021 [Agromyces cerinus subsp. cerinus]
MTATSILYQSGCLAADLHASQHWCRGGTIARVIRVVAAGGASGSRRVVDMFQGFTGWHALIILGVLVFFAAIAVGVLLLIRYAAKSGTTEALESAGPPTAGAGERLDQLERLRAEARITDAEYAAKRAEILRGI